MDQLLHYWPLIAFMLALFAGGMSMAVGLTLWIMGHLNSQDGKRLELKESLLLEIRERHHTAMGRVEQMHSAQQENILAVESKIDNKLKTLAEATVNLGNRVVRVETLILNGGHPQN